MFKFAKESLKVLTCIAAGAAGQHIMSKEKLVKTTKLFIKTTQVKAIKVIKYITMIT